MSKVADGLDWEAVDLSCPATAFRHENGGAELRTGDCPTITAQVVLEKAIEAGSTVEVELAHGTLKGPPEEQVTIEVTTPRGTEFSLSKSLKNTKGAVISPEFRLVADNGEPYGLERGDWIRVRISNHGANYYSLYDVLAGCPGSD